LKSKLFTNNFVWNKSTKLEDTEAKIVDALVRYSHRHTRNINTKITKTNIHYIKSTTKFGANNPF